MKITINIDESEKIEVLNVIKKHFNGKVTSVAKIADEGELNPNHVRYVIEDLVQEGRLIKEPVKDFGPHYKRFRYVIPQGVK